MARSNRHNIVTELLKRYFEQTGKTFKYPKSNDDLEKLRKLLSGDSVDGNEKPPPPQYKLLLVRSAIDNYDRVYTWIPDDPVSVAMPVLLQMIIKDNPSIKLIVTAVVHFKSAIDPLKEITVDLIQPVRIILFEDKLDAIATEITNQYLQQVENYTGVGSGWVFNKLKMIKFDVFKYNPLRIGTFVELPASVKASQCCINVKSDDDMCLVWSVLAALHPVGKDPNRVGKYLPYLKEINTTGIKFPVKIEHIDKFVENNKTILPGGLNIFGLDNSDKLFPRKISKTPNSSTINLLLYKDHFVYIKNFNGLVRKQFSKYKHKYHFCVKCLAGFINQDDLVVHQRYCIHDQRESYPEPGQNILKFENHRNGFLMPVTVSYDFESLLVPVEKSHTSPSRTTTTTHKHVPVSVAYKINSNDPKLDCPVRLYRKNSDTDEEPAVWLLRNLLLDADRILSKKPPKELTVEELTDFTIATHCHVCETKLGHDVVKSHCVITGRYRGAAHQDCAKKCQQNLIPVIAHNFRGYDSHFIITALADPTIQRLIGNHTIEGIPTNSEKFLSLTIRRQLKFIDSAQLIPFSLEQLVKNCTHFSALDKHFNDKSLMMRQKGIFPYEYLTDYSKLIEEKLPPHEKFYSALNGENVTVEEYNDALEIFSALDCKTIEDYFDIYLIQDVLLLSDIITEFRNSSMIAYKLDPCWYVSAPGLACDSMLKITKIELALITDPDKYKFIENGLRGGISVITKKKSTANNKDLSDFDANSPISYLIDLVTNNLYGWAMSEFIPYRCSLWYTEELFNSATENCTKDLSCEKYSFFVEVDVEYPEHLHDAHNDYPFLAEKMTVPDSLLSPEQRINNFSHEKLIPNLLPKRNYICHYRVLHQAVAAGLVVTKVHRALKFNQSPWLAKYIEYNTTMRAKATNDFQRNFYKLMINSVFGKTLENVRNRCNIELVNRNTKRFSKLVALNNFNGRIIIKDDLVFVKKHKTEVLLNKPIFVGVSVLDISKTLMYDFHYSFIKKEYPGAQLCFSDTDSLLYEIPGVDCNDDLYESIYQHRSLFDLSDVDPNDIHGKYHDNTNKKVVGKFKDELNFKPIREFIGLRPKMYSILAVDPKQNKVKSKGIKKSVVAKTFNHELYRAVHSGDITDHIASMTSFQSRLHQVTTIRTDKSGLVNHDDKRYCIDNINTYALGHYRIKGQTQLHTS